MENFDDDTDNWLSFRQMRGPLFNKGIQRVYPFQLTGLRIMYLISVHNVNIIQRTNENFRSQFYK